MAGPIKYSQSPWQESIVNSDELHSPAVGFPRHWKVLGPFQIGTREATWGADPLEYHGGFRSLEYDPEAQFLSSLAPNGSVSWTDIDNATTSSNLAHTNVVFRFPSVDWKFQQAVFGWAALQYQAWARGSIEVYAETEQTVALYTDQVLEFWIDGRPYFGGDFYGFRRAPVILHLDPGKHRLDVRLIRDTRAMGGNYDENGPSVEIDLELKHASKPLGTVTKMLLPDYIEGTLAGNLGSISLQNTDKQRIAVTKISSANSFYSISMTQNSPIYLASGQVRPISFEIENLGTFSPRVELVISYVMYSSEGIKESSSIVDDSQEVRCRSLYEPHKITFLHPGGIVSYAILRPPSKNAQKLCSENTNPSMPVLLQLHGAGLEAENDMVAHALDPVPDLCAWVLYPTGVTPWSGDDWHTWGFADVEAAISAVPDWIRRLNWKGPKVETERWIVSGHSNGGQGSWYAATHRPDNVVALAPVSGYLSIQSYVSYDNWKVMDPRRQAVIQASLNNYRHELLADNLKGIPVLQQHGSQDDNVPVWHSRVMHQLIEQAGWCSSYCELLGKEHWFDGIMTTEHLRDFYKANSSVSGGPAASNQMRRRLPRESFSLTVASPADMGSKNGIKVLLLDSPDQYGRIDMKLEGPRCILTTLNILSFQVQNCWYPEILEVDGWKLSRSEEEYTTLFRSSKNEWLPLKPGEDRHRTRFGRQLGPMDAILRSRGAFQIRDLTGAAPEIALQISRNLNQYFDADTIISSDLPNEAEGPGNVIDIFLIPSPSELNTSDTSASHRWRNLCDGWMDLRHSKEDNYLRASLRLSDGREKSYGTTSNSWGFSGAFLSPLENERLSLAIWGTSHDALRFASRLVPMLTGVGLPDFVLCDQSCTWKGAEGVLAMGFFDHNWKITATSFLS